MPGQTAAPSTADTEMAAAPSAMFAEDAPAELPARKRWLALAVLCVTVLVANLDSTILNVALPTLVRDLNDADDLFQQTGLVLWRKYEQFDPSRSFVAWAPMLVSSGGS